MNEELTLTNDQLLTQTFLAVGFPIGLLAAANDVDPLNHGDPLFWIRFGDKFHGVMPLSMLIWLRATTPASGEEIYQYLLENKFIESPDTLLFQLNELLDEGLIVSFNQTKLSTKIMSLRVIAQGLGLGINPDNSQEFLIGHFDGRPVAGLDFVSYILWMYFDGLRTLQQAIKDAGTFLQVEQGALIGHVSSLLVVLLKTRSVYLDISPKPSTQNKKAAIKKFNYPF